MYHGARPNANQINGFPRFVAGASVLLSAFTSSVATAQNLPAFPGAKGPGATATGGRAGDVYHVTRLDAHKNGVLPGALQYGINNAGANGRTIMPWPMERRTAGPLKRTPPQISTHGVHACTRRLT